MAVAVAVMFTSAEVQALSNSLVTELGRKGRKGAQRRLAREGRGRDAGPPLPASACPGLPARRGRCRRPPPSPPPSPGGDREGLGAASPGTGQRRRWTCRLWPGSCPSCPPRPRCPPPPPPGSLPRTKGPEPGRCLPLPPPAPGRAPRAHEGPPRAKGSPRPAGSPRPGLRRAARPSRGRAPPRPAAPRGAARRGGRAQGAAPGRGREPGRGTPRDGCFACG